MSEHYDNSTLEEQKLGHLFSWSPVGCKEE